MTEIIDESRPMTLLIVATATFVVGVHGCVLPRLESSAGGPGPQGDTGAPQQDTQGGGGEDTGGGQDTGGGEDTGGGGEDTGGGQDTGGGDDTSQMMDDTDDGMMDMGMDDEVPIADVAKILENHCYGCHGPGSGKPFSMESPDPADVHAATVGQSSPEGPIVEPNEPDASLLYLKMDDGSMPPGGWAEGNFTVIDTSDKTADEAGTAAQELIREWIAQGAPNNAN